jgi:hypothetical protein
MRYAKQLLASYLFLACEFSHIHKRKKVTEADLSKQAKNGAVIRRFVGYTKLACGARVAFTARKGQLFDCSQDECRSVASSGMLPKPGRY